MSNYDIYCEMFKKCHELENVIIRSLKKHCATIYTVDVFVGNEDSKEYELYVDYSLNGNYHSYRLNWTEEKIIKHFI